MPEPTPEAWAQIRYAYENTDQPLAHICADHEITIPMLRYRMKRWEWKRRKPLIPREGPPPVLPSVIPGRGPQAANPESITPAPAYGFRARADSAPETHVNALRGASRNDGESEYHPTPTAGTDDAAIVPRLQSAVARVLPAIEATIARLAAGPYHAREMEQAGRALSSLTRTLRELNGLLSEHNARPGGACNCNRYDDMPEDIDEFRHALARKIEAFFAAETDPDSVVPGSALPPQK
jgi:hypothetical protein